VFGYEPKQGDIKYKMIISWYKNHIVTKHGIQLMRMDRNINIMPTLACALTSIIYPLLKRADIWT